MASIRRYSYLSNVLNRWYRAFTILVTCAVMTFFALAIMPRKDERGSYATYPYGLMTDLERTNGLNLLFQLRELRHPELRGRGLREPITIIEVNEDSIRDSNVRLQKWPRNWYGRLIQHASEAGANIIGLDVYVSEAGGVTDFDRAADQQLLEAITNAGNVVIAQRLDAGGPAAIIPLPGFAEAAPGVGFVDLPHEDDSFVRTAPVTAVRDTADGQKETLLSFASLIAQLYDGQPFESVNERLFTFGNRQIPLRDDLNLQIDFRGRSPAFTRVSARDILCEEFKTTSAPSIQCDPSRRPAAELFRDRIVLIGATNNDAPDLITTPFYTYSPLVRLFVKSLPDTSALTPGVEVHANVIATLLFGKALHRPGRVGRVIAVIAPLALLALAIFYLRPLWGLFCAVVLAASVLLISSWAFNNHGLILPLASIWLGAGLITVTHLGSRKLLDQLLRRIENVLIMDSFSRCVSTEVAQEVFKRRGQLTLRGERRVVTVVFTDIRGFTTLSENSKPEDVVEWLNDYFNRMYTLVAAHGGHINKFLGDGLMIVFGAPVEQSDEEEARAAVDCGLAMLEAVDRMNKEWIGTGRPRIRIGLGIHTGEAICGFVGAEQRLEYTAIGDSVNLASRLEAITKEYDVPLLVSDATSRLLSDSHETRELCEVKVRGKDVVTKVHTVVGKKPALAELANTTGKSPEDGQPPIHLK